MNKLKSIFCTAFLFIVCAVMCVGCSVNFSGNIDENGNGSGSGTILPGDPGNSGSTGELKPGTYNISLDDAEEIILDGLFLVGLADGYNRDVYEKFGKIFFSSTQVGSNPSNPADGYITVGETAVIEYSDGEYRKGEYIRTSPLSDGGMNKMFYYMENNSLYSCADYSSDEEIVYNSSVIEEDEVFTFQLADLAMKQIFSQKWFGVIYGEEAEKIIKEEGYTIRLQGDLKSCMYLSPYIRAGEYEDFDEYEAALKALYDQEVIDECFVRVDVEFDKNKKITKVKFEAVLLYPDAEMKDHWTMSIEPSDAVITAPEWIQYC